jgi:hypothetical protein
MNVGVEHTTIDRPEPADRLALGRRRFLILATILLVLTTVQQWHGHWLGDFWEHSAVVRELARHPRRPAHPQLALDAPHAFFTPYHLAVAIVARFTGLGAISALAVAGTLNLLLLLLGIYRFAVDVLRDRAAAPIMLVLMLLLWGFPPFIFSGFISGALLGLVLPYPSTLATAVTLIGMALEARWVNESHGKPSNGPGILCKILVLAGLQAMVVLTHPVTAALFICATLAFALDAARQRKRAPCIALLTVAPAGIALATLWPYYPLWQLLTAQSAVYNASNETIYPGVLLVLAMLGPVLLGVGPMFMRMRRNPTDPLAHTAMALGAIYLIGGVTGHWTLGRVLAALAILFQAALASWLAAQGSHGSRARRRMRAVVLTFCIAWGILSLEIFGLSLKPRLDIAVPQYNDQYAFIETFTHEGDVVFADLEAGWMIPTFGGKIVATQHPLAFVPDHRDRQADLVRFFAPGTSIDERRELIARYDAKFVLLRNGQTAAPDDEAQLRSLGKVVREADGLTLIRIEN